MSQSNSHKLTIYILVAMVLGIAVGLALNVLNAGLQEGMVEGGKTWIDQYLNDGLFYVFGQGFVRLLRMLVVPLVLVSLVCGTAALGDIRKLGTVGGKTVVFYLFTTAVAISLAMGVALLVKPGAGFPAPEAVSYQAKEAAGIADVFLNIIPSNPFRAMVEGEMLQIIVFAILVGLALLQSGAIGQKVLRGFEMANEVIMQLVLLVMWIAPVGVFALIAKTFATMGFEAIPPLAKYFFVVLAVLLIHAFVVYTGLLTLFTRLNPIQFWKKMFPVQLFAFSTASSGATIPVTLETVEKKMGVDNSVASFTVPLGATINMDGTAIMQGAATIFIAQVYAIDLSLGQLLQVVLTATLASIGTAGVPGVGLVMLAMVLKQVGLPVEAIGLILGIDRLLDMTRTAVNVAGDSVVSLIVGKSEGKLDQSIFDDVPQSVSETK